MLKIIEKILQWTKAFVQKDSVNTALVIYRIIWVLITLPTIATSLLYGLGYSFLYGFYFGGKMTVTPSVLDALINPVPFNIFSTISISIVILYSIYLVIIFITKFIRDFSFKKLFSVILFAIVLNLCMTFLFLGSNHDHFLSDYFTFAIFWTFPAATFLFILWIAIFSTNPYIGLSSTAYAFLITAVVASVLQLSNNTFTITILLSFPLSMILFFPLRSIKNSILKITIGCFSVYFLTIAVIFVIYFIHEIKNGVLFFFIIFGMPLLFSYLTALFIHIRKRKTPVQSHESSKNHDSKTNSKTFMERWANNKLELIAQIVPLSFLAFCIIIFLVFTFGQCVRISMPNRTLDSIEYSDNKSAIQGNIVAEKNSVYYISSTNCELIIVKSDHVLVKPYLPK